MWQGPGCSGGALGQGSRAQQHPVSTDSPRGAWLGGSGGPCPGRSSGHAARAHLQQRLPQLHFRGGFISSWKKLDSAEREAGFCRLTGYLGADPGKSGPREGATWHHNAELTPLRDPSLSCDLGPSADSRSCLPIPLPWTGFYPAYECWCLTFAGKLSSPSPQRRGCCSLAPRQPPCPSTCSAPWRCRFPRFPCQRAGTA